MEELNNEFKIFEAFERQFKDGDTKAGKDARKTLQRIKSLSQQLRMDILNTQKLHASLKTEPVVETKSATVEVKDVVKVSVAPKPKEIKIEISPPLPKKKRKKPQTSSK